MCKGTGGSPCPILLSKVQFERKCGECKTLFLGAFLLPLFATAGVVRGIAWKSFAYADRWPIATWTPSRLSVDKSRGAAQPVFCLISCAGSLALRGQLKVEDVTMLVWAHSGLSSPSFWDYLKKEVIEKWFSYGATDGTTCVLLLLFTHSRGIKCSTLPPHSCQTKTARRGETSRRGRGRSFLPSLPPADAE